ncbi:tyrosine kinase [Medicago truncatula]|uniref:Tyrosine kinase n=2 Tax=Medicago truncatula TaxID=3880 RepID=A0A072TKZ8_MEDTR|nr:tyrosine kinase [Medicago truncatula]
MNLLVAQRDMNVRITPPMVMRMELLILQELQLPMRSVTAFCFLNYYYPYFKKFCGFKRHSINEIIVQAQGEHAFAHCMPSHIAISAFLAAVKTQYPSKYSEIAKDITSKIGLQGQVKECVKKMVDLCNRLNIQIESTESGTRSTSSKVTAVPEEEIKEAGTSEEDEDEEWTGLIKQVQDMGKRKARVQVLVQAEELLDDEVRLASGNEVMVVDTSDKKDVKETSLAKGKGKAMERSILDIAEVELKWPTDDKGRNKARIKVGSGKLRRFYSLLCIVLILMQSCESVNAKSSFDFTSSFDYYRLSETWVGTFCRSSRCDKSFVDDRFTIHGLWFDKYPTHCSNEPPSQKNKNKNKERYEIPDDLYGALMTEWPSLTGGKHQNLWMHEWSKHGDSVGFRPPTYFKTALELHNKCRVQQALAKEGIKPGGAEISFKTFKEALEKQGLVLKPLKSLTFDNYSPNQPKTDTLLFQHITNYNFNRKEVLPDYGIGYLHSNEASKPRIVNQNISVENVLLDKDFNPLIRNAGLPKLLADDVVFSALKVSAAMGYLAPEYITMGRFTEKSDIYAFGVIVLQVLSGKTAIGGSIRTAFQSFKFDDCIDTNLKGRYSNSEASILTKLGMQCIHESPDERPNMVDVIQELSVFLAHS